MYVCGPVKRNRRIINVIAKPYTVAAVMYSFFHRYHSPHEHVLQLPPFLYKHIFVLVFCALIINRVFYIYKYIYICADNSRL